MVSQSRDEGYAKAQYGLGNAYYYGKGVQQNYDEAVRWYRRAAERGDAPALEALAYMYENGKGVPRDAAEAIRWSRKAADQGDAEAQSFLGFSYAYAQGVPQDYPEAFRWYRKAADQGDRRAQAALTVRYFRGDGVPRDYAQAIRWFGKLGVSCFKAINGGPLGQSVTLLVILSALLILVVPQRRWGRLLWLVWVLLSAAVALHAGRELLSGRVLWFAVFAVCAALSAMVAIAVVVEARRGSKRGADHAQPLTPPEENPVSPA
jgi:hypothetical protein